MGAALAAHLANVGIPVTLLDIVPNKLTSKEEKKGVTLDDPVVRNRIVQDGLDSAKKLRPASFFTSEQATLVKIGNLEDDFGVIKEADWVVEAIIENLEIKRELMARIDEVRSEGTIVSTNTSGIPITSIAEGRSESFKQHFLGTHFFNPPRYAKLVEVIKTKDTLDEVVDFVSHFLEYRVGKGVVFAKDTPNFIANRIGFTGGAFALDYILENEYTVEEVDAITGPAIGRPKTATFRTIDLVGVDVWKNVGSNLIPAISHDKNALRYLEAERSNQLINTLVENEWLGNKTKQGFYKQVRKEGGGKEFWVLNLKTMEHEPPSKPKFKSVGEAKEEDDLDGKLKVMMAAEDRAGDLVRALTFHGMAYSSELIPEIADTPKPIDDAMRWGFRYETGPFETWDMLGVDNTLNQMKSEGYIPADWVEDMLSRGFPSFYQYENGNKVGVYDPGSGKYQKIKRSPAMIVLHDYKVVDKNPGASLWDMADGIACVEFHTKMNIIDEDILSMMQIGFDRLDNEFEGLVIGTQGENFCAGANIFMLAMLSQNEDWEQLDYAMSTLQSLNMRMRYSPKPIVIAPTGFTLGGGLEITMHAPRVVAGAEMYAGQVEVGIGVIPAGGGTKELLRRILNPAMRTQNAEALPFLVRIIELIAMGKVASSSEEAREFGFLNSCDRVVFNRDHLLAEAKKEVLNMVNTGYIPPLPEKIYAAGRDALAAAKVQLYMFQEGNFMTDHHVLIANKSAHVITGGEISKPTWVDEQYILDLEREAFLSLCGEEKTQDRMWHFLRTGKPLFN
jgi:3-hydroxyacyl-CoA dehydrogenase